MLAKRTKSPPPRREQSPVVAVRRLPELKRLTLFVRAGGRCELLGCNDYLLEHHLTLTEGNFAQVAHIVAFSRGGPRANVALPAKYINDLDNLMVLCHKCHKLVDDHPAEYPVVLLKRQKAEHEDRVRHVTGLGPELKTTPVVFKARIAGRTIAVPSAQVAQGVKPRYPADKKGVVIDLTEITSDGDDFLRLARDQITRTIAQLSAPAIDGAKVQHVSLFALGPIPLLVHLGRELSDKIEVDLFQRHRDTEDWVWKHAGRPIEYVFRAARTGTDPSAVALCLSLSGAIAIDGLPKEIDDRFTVYELTLADVAPNPSFLNRRDDLERFKVAYQLALRTIGRVHGAVDKLHLFPAVPAPLAVLCGRQLLPKVDPTLAVYDADKAKGGFTLAMEVN
jgi:hypothetical protein